MQDPRRFLLYLRALCPARSCLFCRVVLDELPEVILADPVFRPDLDGLHFLLVDQFPDRLWMQMQQFCHFIGGKKRGDLTHPAVLHSLHRMVSWSR